MGVAVLTFSFVLSNSKERLQQLDVPRGAARVVKSLIDSVEDMLTWSDCRHEFVLCEISKVIDLIAPVSGLHAKRLRG